MIKMRNVLTTLIASSMAMAMVLGTSITAHAGGDQYADRRSTNMTPGGVTIYGCYNEGNNYTEDFPVEYLLAIDAAGITDEMSDYEKCVRVNNYLCAVAEYGSPDVTSRNDGMINDATLDKMFSEIETADDFIAFLDAATLAITPECGIDLIRYGKGYCQAYADAFQTMTSMLGINSYVYGSDSLNHAWNAVVIDDVIYFVDVTWNDNTIKPNGYLMSTVLWDDHNASDIKIAGTSSGGWEKKQAEYRQSINEIWEIQSAVEVSIWDTDS